MTRTPLRHEVGHQGRGGAVRQGQEDGVDVRQGGVDVVAGARQVRMRDAHGLVVADRDPGGR